MSDLDGNPEDRFCHDAAHIFVISLKNKHYNKEKSLEDEMK